MRWCRSAHSRLASAVVMPLAQPSRRSARHLSVRHGSCRIALGGTALRSRRVPTSYARRHGCRNRHDMYSGCYTCPGIPRNTLLPREPVIGENRCASSAPANKLLGGGWPRRRYAPASVGNFQQSAGDWLASRPDATCTARIRPATPLLWADRLGAAPFFR